MTTSRRHEGLLRARDGRRRPRRPRSALARRSGTSAMSCATAAIGARCNIGQNVVISPQCTVGDNVKIQNNVSVYTGVVLEDDVFCGPSMVFTNVINPRSHVERKDEYRKTLVRSAAPRSAPTPRSSAASRSAATAWSAPAAWSRATCPTTQSSTATRRACGAGSAGAASASTSAATTARPAKPAARPADASTGARGGMSPSAEAGARAPVRLMQVVGARPQFVKLAPVCRAIAAANAGGARIENFVVHTGPALRPGDVRRLLRRARRSRRPTSTSASARAATAARPRACWKALEAAMLERRPDLVLTYGDTNSTLAATLAAAKLHLPLAHVEAGLRSFNRRMPEEANRLVADHLSDLLFAPTPESMKNLANEGLGARARQVGRRHARRDARLRAGRARTLARPRTPRRLRPAATWSRRCTAPRTRPPSSLGPLLAALAAVGCASRPVILPMHPRTAHVMPRRRPCAAARPGTARDRAARLPRHDRARRPRAHRAHGLRRPAEGGVLPRQALRDAARADGMGRDGLRRRQRRRRHRRGADPRCRRGLGRGARARRAGFRRARCAHAFGDGAASAKIVAQILQFLADQRDGLTGRRAGRPECAPRSRSRTPNWASVPRYHADIKGTIHRMDPSTDRGRRRRRLGQEPRPQFPPAAGREPQVRLRPRPEEARPAGAPAARVDADA